MYTRLLYCFTRELEKRLREGEEKPYRGIEDAHAEERVAAKLLLLLEEVGRAKSYCWMEGRPSCCWRKDWLHPHGRGLHPDAVLQGA